jgi:hypothetical protein
MERNKKPFQYKKNDATVVNLEKANWLPHSQEEIEENNVGCVLVDANSMGVWLY